MGHHLKLRRQSLKDIFTLIFQLSSTMGFSSGTLNLSLILRSKYQIRYSLFIAFSINIQEICIAWKYFVVEIVYSSLLTKQTDIIKFEFFLYFGYSRLFLFLNPLILGYHKKFAISFFPSPNKTERTCFKSYCFVLIFFGNFKKMFVFSRIQTQ